MSNRRFQNTINNPKNQRSNITQSPYQNTTPLQNLRKAIIQNNSQNHKNFSK